MQLGAFCMSLAVKDLKASRAFYEKLGFTYKGGNEEEHYLVLRNGDAVIGLFEGMFDNNILTFNPGWKQDGSNVDPFEDVRLIEQQLEKAGISFDQNTDPSKPEGPNHFVITDPDGNHILVDQHR